MIHAYNEVYLNIVMHNLGALFDIAINALEIDINTFANQFVNSRVASGIEAGTPDMLAGKSATEMLMIILDKKIDDVIVPADRTKEYWAGWILANAQWYLNKSFKEIVSVMPFSKLIALYYPYHEANEMKTIEKIATCFPQVSTLKTLRQKRKLTQEELALLSGVKVRSIRSYEQGQNELSKAQGDTLLMLAKALDCSIEDLLK
ncbi:helix-turn-helix domain-containing protein [Thomasclavelia cocleata]|uniref:helix-turn-helix domain-containing protein n=1 Tax=Thomasclavelia cocleata TaxID=69824 RepID=UPI0025841EA1|nr:helix-turn-helix transcriptional regulator [Thomasclavelia cocleata]